MKPLAASDLEFSAPPIAPRKRPFAASRVAGLAQGAMLVWLGLTVAGIFVDQILMLPGRPASPAERAAAMPRIEARWRDVYAQLSVRLHGPPPEMGPVWVNRHGRICGLVDHREAGIDSMAQFYTLGSKVTLREDDEVHSFMRAWMTCLGDQWIVLRGGTADTGFCATRRGRATPIAAVLCVPHPPRPIPLDDQ